MVYNSHFKLANALKSALKTPSPITKRKFFKFPDVFSSKKTYNGNKVVGYTQKQLYDVVSNIDNYHFFIPYCTSSEVLKTRCINKRTKHLTAALGIGFKGFSETYISEVTCEKPGLVKAEAPSDGIFTHLTTIWRLTPHQESSAHCYIDFYLEFEFTSILYSHLANAWFDQVSVMVIDAFEKRCNELYGPPAASLIDD